MKMRTEVLSRVEREEVEALGSSRRGALKALSPEVDREEEELNLWSLKGELFPRSRQRMRSRVCRGETPIRGGS